VLAVDVAALVRERHSSGVVFAACGPLRPAMHILNKIFDSEINVIVCIGLSRYIAITLSIIAVFVEYLPQFFIDLHQIYRHSSEPKTRLRAFFGAF